jgi:hypothetical protein
MVERMLDWLKRPIFRVGLLVVLVLLVSGFSWGVYQTQRAPEQPIEFPHNVHVGLGVQCLYCHSGAWSGASAGLPTQSKCWGCHQQIAKQTPELDKLFSFIENKDPIPWVPVAIMPDFVQFNHRPHIAGGLNCEICHGDMTQVTVAKNPQVMNMGWCLDCHREQSQGDRVKMQKLLDCLTCHY